MKVRETLIVGTTLSLAACSAPNAPETPSASAPAPATETRPSKVACYYYIGAVSLADSNRALFKVEAVNARVTAANKTYDCSEGEADILEPDSSALTDDRTVLGTIGMHKLFRVTCANNDPDAPLIGVKVGLVEGVAEYDINAYSDLRKGVPDLSPCHIPAAPTTIVPSTR